jgi:regulator of protease activity HflC (stomatin/prohibitin superfamily)
MKMINLVLMLVMLMIVNGCTRIDVGHVGLKINLASSDRGVQKHTTVTGWVFYNPATQQVVEYPTNVQSVIWTKDINEGSPVDESLTFSSKEGLIINSDVALAYHVDSEKAPLLYTRFRQDDLSVLTHGYVRNVVRNSLNFVAQQMTVQDIYGTKKSYLEEQAKAHASGILNPDGFVVDQLTFASSLRLPTNVEKAINMAIEQNQASIAAENKVAQVRAEAEQKVVRAKGDADAVLTYARGEAEANETVTKSLTPQLLQYKLQAKWDGKLPQVTGNAVPMIDVNLNK